MGYDYCTVDGTGEDRLPKLMGWEVSIALSALAYTDLFDETRPPEDPEFSFDEDDEWPFCVELTDSDRAWFGFRSPEPDRIPSTKLCDNSPWIIDPVECALLRRVIAEVIAGERTRTVDPWVFTRLAECGLEGKEVGAEIERCLQVFSDIAAAGEDAGGFWSY